MTTPRKRVATQPVKADPAPTDPVDELAAALREYHALQPAYTEMVTQVDAARRRLVTACEACGIRSTVLR